MSALSLTDAVHKWSAALYANGASDSTTRHYVSVGARLARAYPRYTFARVGAAELNAFFYGPEGIAVGKLETTVSFYRAAIRSLFRYGHAMGWRKDVPATPAPVVRTVKMRQTATATPTRLTATQITLMIGSARHPILRAMLAIAANTALRVCDIRKLRIGELDLTVGDLRVVAQKTGHVDVLPVTIDLDAEMRRYLTWLTASTGATVADAELFLLPGIVNVFGEQTLTHQRPVSYDWSRTRLLRLYRESGVHVEPKEAWHTLRRSVARIYFDSMRDEVSFDHALRRTAVLLGHRNTITTERYLGLDAERLARDESLRGRHLIVPGGSVTALHSRRAL